MAARKDYAIVTDARRMQDEVKAAVAVENVHLKWATAIKML